MFQRFIGVLFTGISSLFCLHTASAQSAVVIREVDEVIPTYLAGPPDLNPMFYFGKGSQGAEGRIYPYPLYDNLTNRKRDKTYHVVYMENEYIRISILPEIGGRLFSALDKSNNYDYIYQQKVIKPALIGLTGAWISGGIEWNIPHHHRASTFIPVQWHKEEHADGSKTIWVGELEVRHRMRWAVGYTLRPGSSILECSVRIINRTPMANTMLCFANVAVGPNEDYNVIFPPATQWSTGHGKRTFSPWPVTDNVDVSWYKNNKRPASWFAVNYEDDFVAGYDHGVNAGILSVADHNVVPGKKFFTWGVGSMWDKILSDDGKPYLEIMVGAYSDNQPDYSWLQPYEEKSFEINFYPFRGIDGVKNANLDAAVNLDVQDGNAIFGFYTTKAYTGATVRLNAGDKVLLEEEISINPGKPYANQVAVPVGVDPHNIRASISADGRELIAYSPIRLHPSPVPVGTTNPETPAEIENNEELFLVGQRIDQFHNPTLDADPYWEELLRRDSLNVAANTGMALLDLRRAKYQSAEKHLLKAIHRLTAQYTTPKNAEPFYYLGVALRGQGRFDEAFTSFYKATWSQHWKSPGYFSLAEIATMRGDFSKALEFVNRSIDANALNLRAYGLRASALRHLDRTDEAMSVVAFAKKKCDPLDVRLMAEQWLSSRDVKNAQPLFETLNSHPATAQEIAAEYYNAGLWNDGMDVLQAANAAAPDKTHISPMIYYYLGYFAERLGDQKNAAAYWRQAALQSPDYVFPFQAEAVTVLRRAIDANPKDARALYYLGNLLFDWQPEEAVAFWEKSVAIDPEPIALRNLAQAYFHKTGDAETAKAISYLEKAVAVPDPNPTHLAELNLMYKAAGAPVEKRLALLEKNREVVLKKDEALGALINLKTFAGETEESIALLKSRVFSIWEGGNSFNTGQAWADAHLVQGLRFYKAKKYREALDNFKTALSPPDNLRADRRRNSRRTQLSYWIGCAYDALGEKDLAIKSWSEITDSGEDSNGPDSDDDDLLDRKAQTYYIALAQRKLGRKTQAESAFHELAATNTETVLSQSAHEGDPQFIRSRRPPSRDNLALPHYIAGLGYAGLGNKARARENLNAALAASPDYLSAKIALGQL